MLGDIGFINAAVDRIEEPAATGDPVMQALLAECLQERAAVADPGDALADLERARSILDRLFDPEYPIPHSWWCRGSRLGGARRGFSSS
jgi:hypothetical protein